MVVDIRVVDCHQPFKCVVIGQIVIFNIGIDAEFPVPPYYSARIDLYVASNIPSHNFLNVVGSLENMHCSFLTPGLSYRRLKEESPSCSG